MKPGMLDTPRTSAPSRPALKADEVHVWRVNVDDVAPLLPGMTCILSPEERDRAERFRFPGDWRHFVVRHAGLRLLLGRYLDADPAALGFALGPHGKPALVDRGKDALSFSMSRSGDIVLYAVTRDREVGIDVEWCLRDVDCLDIARQFFSAREAEALSALDHAQRRLRFFRLWTCKEAYLKAVGQGLSFPMNEVEVSLHGGNRPVLESIGGSDWAARQWSCWQWTPAEDYIAAVVAEGSDWKTSCRVLPRWTVLLSSACW